MDGKVIQKDVGNMNREQIKTNHCKARNVVTV